MIGLHQLGPLLPTGLGLDTYSIRILRLEHVADNDYIYVYTLHHNDQMITVQGLPRVGEIGPFIYRRNALGPATLALITHRIARDGYALRSVGGRSLMRGQAT